MKKIKLFSEHQDITLYGRTLEEAFKSRPIPREDAPAGEILRGSKMIRTYRDQEPIVITEIFGEEKIINKTRGNIIYRRMVCNTNIAGIIGIDFIELDLALIPIPEQEITDFLNG